MLTQTRRRRLSDRGCSRFYRRDGQETRERRRRHLRETVLQHTVETAARRRTGPLAGRQPSWREPAVVIRCGIIRPGAARSLGECAAVIGEPQSVSPTEEPMADGLKFVKRNRRTAGRATGRIACSISIPALGETFAKDIILASRDGVRVGKLTKLRQFAHARVPHTGAEQAGASLSIKASVRRPNGAIGWKRLGQWQPGQSIDQAFAEAEAVWRQLPKEDGWAATEVVSVPTRTTASRKSKGKAV